MLTTKGSGRGEGSRSQIGPIDVVLGLIGEKLNEPEAEVGVGVGEGDGLGEGLGVYDEMTAPLATVDRKRRRAVP